MENKNPEETPVLNLDGTVSEEKPAVTETAVPIVKSEEIPKKDQDYYVDPLEQDALMQEKIKKINEEKIAREGKQLGETAAAAPEPTKDEDIIRPDMTVNGFFSANQTAKKVSFVKNPASSSSLKIGIFAGAINSLYALVLSGIYISNNFSLNWILGLIYAYVVVSTIVIMINALRSKNAANESIKKDAMISLVLSIVSLLPILLLIIGQFVA